MEEKELKNEATSVKEETSLKENENKFLKVLKMIGHYLKDVFLNFKESFKYNNMKLPALLIAIPGLLLGFFLNFHYNVVVQLIICFNANWYIKYLLSSNNVREEE